MRKLILAISSFVFIMTSAIAEVNLGVSGVYIDVEASGTETLKQSKAEQTKKHTDNAAAAELFMEVVTDNGLTIGVALMPGKAEIGTKTATRTDKLQTGSSSVTQKAQAEFSGHTTIYAHVPIGSSAFYGKLGGGFVDVDTNESLGTGASYGNESVSFATVGLGFQRDMSNGLFMRAEATYSDYEKFELKSTNSDAVSTIKADIETITGRVSVGKSF
jgi:hypothetical protein